jgi:alkanesulfonate monooxygenase SsuD/methylene tetrahydromethanopterin reductase-like flavin-dependent oxidoreductase (luciferase family)
MAESAETQPIGLLCQYDDPVATQLDHVTRADRSGFTEVWQSEYRLGRDAVTPSVAYATATENVRVGLGVVNPWTRNPALIAQTLSTMAELAGPDRVAGGIGAWWDPLASQVGIDRRSPLRAIRETVEAVRGLLDGETVTYDGSFVSLDGVDLEFDHHETGPPLETGVYVGATGFTTLQLTGEFADGCLGNYLVSRSYNERAYDALARGAARVDRDPDDVSRSQVIVVAMDPDYETALQAARRFVLEYYAPRPTVSEPRKVSGITQEVIDDLMDELGGWPADEATKEAAAATIPEDVVTEVVACGTAEDVRDRVREYAETEFCECPVVYPVTDDVPAVIDAFADGYR